MGMTLRRSINLGLVVLIAGYMSGAIAYQQDKSATQAGTRVAPSEVKLLPDQSRSATAEKPAKCYLAYHLELVGSPFATGIADTATGVAHACYAEPRQKDRETKSPN